MDHLKQPADFQEHYATRLNKILSNMPQAQAWEIDNRHLIKFAEILEVFPIMMFENIELIVRNHREHGKETDFYFYMLCVGSYHIQPHSNIIMHYVEMLQSNESWRPANDGMQAELSLLKAVFHTIRGSIRKANQCLQESTEAIKKLRQRDPYDKHVEHVKMLTWGYMSLAKLTTTNLNEFTTIFAHIRRRLIPNTPIINSATRSLLEEEQASVRGYHPPAKCICCGENPMPPFWPTSITDIRDESLRQKTARLRISHIIANATSACFHLPYFEDKNPKHSLYIVLWIKEFVETSAALSDQYRLFTFHR
ncbi:hypothetical protein M441DRAFT_48221 [Trichoderma asperellum CBS 433.97]|uniref:Uncharacterized protein n=1 Tax=Trichoderma asperellum (strain ATCC 204424 / CBS 433.97 / NBRC 101777) TaxID=1042311 RepID=A0A2T3Z6F2_TRIA4|nr:hypothetical protein M441DRAFT_48221 [Trichoderma asperellum CBS 433.97]PTB40377.1 hypothetical protein M441DRAFT_48221 [Trichoderma asperellum CBS 433.97]